MGLTIEKQIGGRLIKKAIKKPGALTASAKRAGMSTRAYANKVLNNPNASGLQKKRANFAKNAMKASRGG